VHVHTHIKKINKNADAKHIKLVYQSN